MKPAFHIAGCALTEGSDPLLIGECVDWVRRYGATVLKQEDNRALFVHFDAVQAQVIMHGCRATHANKPPVLRFGFASVVKETAPDGSARASERGLAQAADLAAAAQPGQVLVSSQLGSLLQLAEIEPAARLKAIRLPLADGRTASAYEVQSLRLAGAAA